MKKFIMWVVDCWRLVMDNRYNPLKYIPDPSLRYIYTCFICNVECILRIVASYYMGWLGYSIVTSIIVHVAVILPVAFTNAVILRCRA